MKELNEDLARNVLATVDAGLVKGLGAPEPGSMCVEAAVCYAMGLPHSDKPTCVGSEVRRFKIKINDARWSSDKARTAGLRRLAVAQLGSDSIDQQKFVRIVVEQTIRQIVPRALRLAKKRNPAHEEKLEAAAIRCEQDGDRGAALSARNAAYAAADAADAAAADAAAAAADAAADAADAAYAAAYAAADAAAYAYAAADAAYAADAADAAADEVLNLACGIALNALIELQSPGCAYLYLCDVAEA